MAMADCQNCNGKGHIFCFDFDGAICDDFICPQCNGKGIIKKEYEMEE